MLLKPPFSRKNPYTGSNLVSDIISFPENHLEPKNLKKWFLDNIPDYTTKGVTSSEDLAAFLARDHGRISKLIFLSGKQKAPQSVGALSAIYRDRVHFAFINESTQAGAEVKAKYGVEGPTAVLLIDQQGQVHSYSGSMKVPELSEWVSPHALASKLEQDAKIEAENFLKAEWEKAQTKTVKSTAEFEKYVLSNEKAALVYYSTENEKPDF